MSPHAIDVNGESAHPINGMPHTQLDNCTHLQPVPPDETHDVVCVGFGPANLAFAIALHDALDRPLPGLKHMHSRKPRVLFLEQQQHFAWHEGMLLPGTKMQISFLKDLATLRDPRSEFTFLNYLHKKNRLVQFTNLDTFLPQRVEYHDYMAWCASRFENVVNYGHRVTKVIPETLQKGSSTMDCFNVLTEVKDKETEISKTFRARHVVIGVGGKPYIPKPFPQSDSRVLHSSEYAKKISNVLANPLGHYKIAVIGSGQSAAEVFNDLHSRYPNATTRLVIRGSALRPSDDSPFVNEIFDPSQVDHFYHKVQDHRRASLAEDKNTNYGVVRHELLERIYATLYIQSVQKPDEQSWQHRILKRRIVVDVRPSSKSVCLVLGDAESDHVDCATANLHLQHRQLENSEEAQRVNVRSDVKYAQAPQPFPTNDTVEMLMVDVVIVAAGYKRDAHEVLLTPARKLMPDGDKPNGQWIVERDYRVRVEEGKLSRNAGIWLQGCNESTHGLSDTLLSILAPRAGELLHSIFGYGEVEAC